MLQIATPILLLMKFYQEDEKNKDYLDTGKNKEKTFNPWAIETLSAHSSFGQNCTAYCPITIFSNEKMFLL
jgi:hypothetical protein